MIATLNGTALMVGKMRVASISHSPKGFKWHAIFGGGRTGRKFFPTFTAAIKACAKSCGLTVRVPASWEEVKVVWEFDSTPESIKGAVRIAINHVARELIYGEDEILAAIQTCLNERTAIKAHNLYIHRGGHHVAICAGHERLAMITAEDREI